MLSCAGEDFSGAKYFPIAHSNRDLNYSGSIPTATTSDPRSQEAVVLSNALTSLVACDQGSVLVVGNKLEVMYFTTRSCPY